LHRSESAAPVIEITVQVNNICGVESNVGQIHIESDIIAPKRILIKPHIVQVYLTWENSISIWVSSGDIKVQEDETITGIKRLGKARRIGGRRNEIFHRSNLKKEPHP
jgi:hypothetical protein